MTRALRGPVDLLGEDERSNDARNITFELIVAGRLAAANLKPSFGDGTDTSTTFAETTFVFECKRPLSAARIEQAISKARAQLTNSTGKVGIIALSVSRLLNPGDPFSVPVTGNGDEAYAWLKCASAQFIEETRRFWQKDRPGVHGLYVYAFIPMKIGGLYSPVRHDVFAPIKQHGSSTISLCGSSRASTSQARRCNCLQGFYPPSFVFRGLPKTRSPLAETDVDSKQWSRKSPQTSRRETRMRNSYRG